MKPIRLTSFLATCLLLAVISALGFGRAAADPLKGAKRILFLGDSITHGGHYIVFLEAALREAHPEAEFINLGLPSEGCTGLSEPAHPFPRPNVHERLERALTKVNPDLVFACYGMNDGIYYPFSEERFANYQAGINTLIAKVAAHGAPLILLTPPPFDPEPLRKKGKLLPAGAPKYSWMQIYEHYDRDVIARYGKWILKQKGRVKTVIDLHKPVTAFVNEQRKTTPGFALSGDGVHLNKEGHRVIAQAIHAALYQKPLPEIPPATLALLEKRHKIMHASWLSHVGHQRPGVRAGLPLEEARAKADEIKEGS